MCWDALLVSFSLSLSDTVLQPKMKGLALKSLQGALLEWPEGVRGLLEGGCEEIGSELIDTQQV